MQWYMTRIGHAYKARAQAQDSPALPFPLPQSLHRHLEAYLKNQALSLQKNESPENERLLEKKKRPRQMQEQEYRLRKVRRIEDGDR